MKFFHWLALSFVVLICIEVQMGNALPRRSCHSRDGYPHEKCCNECPSCRHHFDVESPKDPNCRKLRNYHYDVEKFTDCDKETYDRLDAAVEELPERGCRKSYHYHYDVEKPCCCDEDSHDTYDFEVLQPKTKNRCSKVKLQAYADHPVRECQCDCNNRRYVVNTANDTQFNSSVFETFADDTSRSNTIPRLRRSIMDPLKDDKFTISLSESSDPRQFFYNTHMPVKSNIRARNRFLRRQSNVPRSKRKEYDFNFDLNGHKEAFVCHCVPANQANFVKAEPDEIVGAPRKSKNNVEPAVYIGDASNPITYEQMKKHLDALPREDYSPTTNDVIGNLTVLFYDIYQQKHKRNFTLPLKYGTRTVIDQGDGLQKYEIEPIEGEYQPPKLNRIASKGLRLVGRKIEQKTDPNVDNRRNRLRKRT
uniref:Spaetzle domain-containing protein n=1 Tax=Anopheles funestus TaxID=62324 RepID=A0A182RYB3_ANOFN